MESKTSWQPAAQFPRYAAQDLERTYPGAKVWYGSATGSWWACLPWGQPGRLLEAHSPEELQSQLDSIFGHLRRRQLTGQRAPR